MKRRVVIKVGSNVLSRADGTLDVTRMSSLVDQVVGVRRLGWDVILVTSGAVACGRSALGAEEGLDSVEQRQLYSAVGQVRLINHYDTFFGEYGVPVGQVLTMKKNFATEEEFQNQKSCMEVMLQHGVVPIVNENDTVCITELMFTDNDELSGLVAEMLAADTLVLLTNVDGIYTGDPSTPGARLIRRVLPFDDLSGAISARISTSGRGGMRSKYEVARRVASEGVRVIIANGERDAIIPDVLLRPEETVCTEFVASARA